MAARYSSPPLLAELGLKDGIAALKLWPVDIKDAAVNEIWSGLKLVIRKDRR